MVISLERRAERTIKLWGDPSDQREEEKSAIHLQRFRESLVRRLKQEKLKWPESKLQIEIR